MTDRCCEVVDSIDCEAAPGYGATASAIVACWGCGGDVCRECSSVIAYPWKGQRRRMRFCFNCQDQRKVGRACPAATVEASRLGEKVRAHAILSNLELHGVFSGAMTWERVNAAHHDRGQHRLKAGPIRACVESNGAKWWNWWITFAEHDGESCWIEHGGAPTLASAKRLANVQLQLIGHQILRVAKEAETAP